MRDRGHGETVVARFSPPPSGDDVLVATATEDAAAPRLSRLVGCAARTIAGRQVGHPPSAQSRGCAAGSAAVSARRRTVARPAHCSASTSQPCPVRALRATGAGQGGCAVPPGVPRLPHPAAIRLVQHADDRLVGGAQCLYLAWPPGRAGPQSGPRRRRGSARRCAHSSRVARKAATRLGRQLWIKPTVSVSSTWPPPEVPAAAWWIQRGNRRSSHARGAGQPVERVDLPALV